MGREHHHHSADGGKDKIVCLFCAFVKAPDTAYAKDGDDRFSGRFMLVKSPLIAAPIRVTDND